MSHFLLKAGTLTCHPNSSNKLEDFAQSIKLHLFVTKFNQELVQVGNGGFVKISYKIQDLKFSQIWLQSPRRGKARLCFLNQNLDRRMHFRYLVHGVVIIWGSYNLKLYSILSEMMDCCSLSLRMVNYLRRASKTLLRELIK